MLKYAKETLYLILTYIALILLLLSFGLFQFTLGMNLMEYLKLTKENWWGILTSALVHKDTFHLYSNI